MIEEWRKVSGYEGYYEVSNLGRVKRTGSKCGVNKMYLGDYCLKPLDNGKGYFRTKLTVNNKSKRVMLHRIIAEAFIDRIEGKNVVNHKNGVKKDNRIENLEWCTQSENCLHAYRIGLK